MPVSDEELQAKHKAIRDLRELKEERRQQLEEAARAASNDQEAAQLDAEGARLLQEIESQEVLIDHQNQVNLEAGLQPVQSVVVPDIGQKPEVVDTPEDQGPNLTAVGSPDNPPFEFPEGEEQPYVAPAVGDFDNHNDGK